MSGKGLSGTARISYPLRCVYEVRQMCKGLSGKGDYWKEEDKEGGRESLSKSTLKNASSVGCVLRPVNLKRSKFNKTWSH